jgi:hypothetical protein
MKKILLLLTILVLSIASYSQTDIGIWTGYSWINGIVGVESQYNYFGIGAGYYPAKMSSGESVPSWGGSVSLYSKNNQSLIQKNRLIFCYYTSIGVASAAYRNDTIPSAMTFGILGIKTNYNRFSIKTGIGYGGSKFDTMWTFEIGIKYIILKNN